MGQKNCWEYKNCKRQSGGAKQDELGVCPASTDTSFNGTNKGVNGGRYCWKIHGTLCEAQVQGDWTSKMSKCFQCDFFKAVRQKEGEAFQA